MPLKKELPQEIARLFREKERRRQELARLPFEEKILILVELQKIASGVGGRRRNPLQCVWPIR